MKFAFVSVYFTLLLAVGFAAAFPVCVVTIRL